MQLFWILHLQAIAEEKTMIESYIYLVVDRLMTEKALQLIIYSLNKSDLFVPLTIFSMPL